MLYVNSVRVAPGVRSALAVACGVALSSGHSAWAQTALEPVVVTASRVPQLLQTAPIGATVITSEQIKRSGVVDANEAIRKLAGIAYKSDLNGGREYSLDLRGFGSSASANQVVLVDGVRISENELAPARLTSIPVEMIDRIEIVRGGSSVMWGEGASAGVINIILKQAEGHTRLGQIGAAVESFGGRDAMASGQWGFGQLALDASAKRIRSDGFRDNGSYAQDVAGAGVQWADKGWRWNARVQQENQNARLPGSITLAEYQANRRKSDHLQDFAENRETRYSSTLVYQWAEWQLQVDAGHRVRDNNYLQWGSQVASTRSQSQVTPRVIYASHIGETTFDTVVGLDWQGWDFEQTGSSDGVDKSTQDNQAVFAQLNATLPSRTRVNVGWRYERIRKDGDYPGNAAWYMSPVNYDRINSLHAGELALSQTLVTGLDAYGRLASSYRMPNVDENRVTPQNGPLQSQENRDHEVGLKWSQGADSATVRYFVQNTKNEIAYISALSANANLDPTRRHGVELEGHWQPTKAVGISATWQQLTAKFRSGPDDGKEMVLVAPHSSTVRASYQVDDRNTVELGAQYLAKTRIDGDADNLCSTRVPSSTLLDARYAWSDRVWTLSVSGANLADKKGYNYDYAYSCSGSSIYPYSGRSIRFAASRQF